ncbi:7TM-DISM domain-containing protein [Bernardetia sp. OM2101]|uniref:7TM-DISM domain-containing protein n=1 Tax=Bernardetia sp. OM2101 TaxID=3344876 RepID=UPI0035CFB0C4
MLFIFSASLSAQKTSKEYLTIDDTTNIFLLNSYLSYYNDEEGNLSIDQINEMSNEVLKKHFLDSLQITDNTKYIWVYFDLKTQTNKDWLINTKTKNSILYTKNNSKWVTHNSSDYLYSNRRFLIPKFNSDTVERIYIKITPYRRMQNKGKTDITLNQKYTYEKGFLEDTIFYMLVVGIVFGLFFL